MPIGLSERGGNRHQKLGQVFLFKTCAGSIFVGGSFSEVPFTVAAVSLGGYEVLLISWFIAQCVRTIKC